MRQSVGLLVAVGTVSVACVAMGGGAADKDAASLVGTKACGMCHKKDETGNQLAKWQASAHAKAFAVLATPEAKEVAKKAGVEDPQKSGKCLKCHSTAYFFTDAVKTDKLTPEEGVSCESCHGPGKDYKAMATMKDKAKSVAAGMIDPASQSCASCHNDQSPTWKADRYTTKDGKTVGFDLEQALKKTEHPNPAAKK